MTDVVQAETRYGITVLTMDVQFFLEISLEEFERIKSAKEKYFRVLGIEEKFDLLLQNYAEYERELIDLTLERMLHGFRDWSAAISDLYIINRRLANLLTVTRLYIDQVAHDISTMYGSKSDITGEVAKVFCKEYDESLGYRVMEALRNFLQHRALPISLAYPTEWDSSPATPKSNLRFAIKPQLVVPDLRREGGFKTAVLEELERDGGTQDLTLLIRQFIGGLSRIHNDLRHRISKDREEWKATLTGVFEQVREPLNGRFLGLAAVKQDASSREYIETLDIFEGPFDRMKFLLLSNPAENLGYLPRWYISSEVR